MRHDEFIGKVQHHADLDSRGAAEEATRSVLETLAERLAGGEADDLADQLPAEIGRHLRIDGVGSERFSPDEFRTRVRERSSTVIDDRQAAHRIHAVLTVTRQAVSPGEFDDVLAQLPDGYLKAFGLE